MGNIKTKDFELFSPKSFFMDDTVPTVALADTILTGINYVDNPKSFYQRYPHRGYGGSFQVGRRVQTPCLTTVGDMELPCDISPVGYAYNDIDTVLQKAADSLK